METDEEYWEHVEHELYVRRKLKEVLRRQFSAPEGLFRKATIPAAERISFRKAIA